MIEKAKDSRTLVCVGKIVAAHGIRGEVKIQSFTDEPTSITAYGDVQDANGQVFLLTISSVKNHNVIATIDGVGDRNAAEALAGTMLYVDRENLPDTEVNAFYHEDLLGLMVQDESGNIVGDVKALHNFGAGDIIEITLQDTGKSEMLAFNEETVPEVDLEKGLVVIRWPEEIVVQNDG